MPKALPDIKGFKLDIYKKDHEPKHVHVKKNRREVKISIGRPPSDDDPGERPMIVKVKKMKESDVRDAWQIVADNQEALLEAWERINP